MLKIINVYRVVVVLNLICRVLAATEWLVTFDSYLTTEARFAFFDEFQNGTNCFFVISPKNNPSGAGISIDFSDFDVIYGVDEFCLRLLKGSTRVRGVYPQNIYYRSLSSSPEEVGHRDDQFYSRKIQTGIFGFLRSDVDSRSSTSSISTLLSAEKLWKLGFTGKGVRVAVFDTGLPENHPDFKNIKEITDWTNDRGEIDAVGHGTFVASVIAGINPECAGMAPDADLYIYRVFTNKQVSYTSWFLDAFNYALMKGVDIINLSIGGPDFMDQPFIEKVWELTANGVILISAIGNDGPLYGTLNNPADQMDVVGVGGINYDDQIARFSSRGMTTWELPGGYGRMKPDIVSYGALVRGSNLRGKCTTLSGTSVASPVIAGATALLINAAAEKVQLNPAIMKQVLTGSARRLATSANMFEQGNGKLDLINAYRHLLSYSPQISLSPSYLDSTECPYFWPYCTQSLFYGSAPIIVNITILNGMSVTSRIDHEPRFEALTSENGEKLNVAFQFSRLLWPWSGWMAVVVGVNEFGRKFEGVAAGIVHFTLRTGDVETNLTFPLKVKISTQLPRQKRILWDQFHSLRYPPNYFPKDNLKIKDSPLDWNADHIHTNFRDLYQHLKSGGYSVEVLGSPFTCFDAKDFSTLLLVDSEEEFFADEISKIINDVNENGLNLIVFADWFNVSVINKIKFFDENTKRMWIPETGGANVPALNSLLGSWNISLGGVVLEGDFEMGGHSMYYASGTSLTTFPEEGIVFLKNLYNYGDDILLKSNSSSKLSAAILGLLKPWKFAKSLHPGRIAIYGDSNCLDSANLKIDCYWLLDALLDYVNHGHLPRSLMSESSLDVLFLKDSQPSRRPTGSTFTKVSNVVDSYDANGDVSRYKSLPSCPEWKWVEPILSSRTSAPNYFQHYKLLTVERLIDFEENMFDVDDGRQIRNKFAKNTSESGGNFVSLFFNLPSLAFVAVLLFAVFYMNRTFFRRFRRKWRRLLIF